VETKFLIVWNFWCFQIENIDFKREVAQNFKLFSNAKDTPQNKKYLTIKKSMNRETNPINIVQDLNTKINKVNSHATINVWRMHFNIS
jgi:hypothetical protein